jgi:competence protein ComEC
MIGLLVGMLSVGLFPALPGRSVLMLVALGGLLLPLTSVRGSRFAGGCLLGCAVAMLHGQQLLSSRLQEACNGRHMTLIGAVASLPKHSVFGEGRERQRFELRIDGDTARHCGDLRKVLFSYYGPETIRPGERWRFEARIKKPWGLANPGSHNMQAWFALSGIDALASSGARGARRLDVVTGTGHRINRLRQQVSDAIAALQLDPDTLAVLQAVAVADKSGLDAGMWMLLQRLGINHLLVISGLHVGLVAGAGYLLGGFASRLLQLAGVRALWLGPGLALALATFYTAMAGFSVATQRALCMLACFIVARLTGRNSGSANGLLLAALLVMLVNPLAALGSGFWLSFAAVAALLWLGRWQRGGWTGWRLFRTHLYMSLIMLPLGGWWFGGASLLAAPANAIMVPLVGLFVVPLTLLGTLLCLAGIPFDRLLWSIAGLPLEWILPLARDLSERGGHLMMWQHSPGPLSLLLAMAGVALAVVPIGWLGRSLALSLLLPALLSGHRAAGDGVAGTRVTVFDVGQGTAVMIQAGRRALLYDTGGGDPSGSNTAHSVVLPFMRRHGIRELDTLVISHGDRDHSAGAGTVLSAVPVHRLRHGGDVPGISQGLKCRAGEAWRWPGGPRFQFLSPASETGLSRNNGSCVLQVETGGHRLLLPGDIEGDQERQLVRYWGPRLESDWLHAAHHGSLTSSSHTWLKHVAPRTVVISSGNANRFGHPHPSVVARLEQAGAVRWNTAREGALTFELPPDGEARVRRHRAEVRRFWM